MRQIVLIEGGENVVAAGLFLFPPVIVVYVFKQKGAQLFAGLPHFFRHFHKGLVQRRGHDVADHGVDAFAMRLAQHAEAPARQLEGLEDAAAETAKLDREGYREIVLTGIEVASYGVDLPGKPGLADVIETVAEAAPHMRIRLSSLEPTVITEDFCRRLAATGKICRHFHLSLQSGCDRTLKAMNRKYDTARFFRATELLREYFPGCALTCDLIVGFPGETEEDHAQTLEFIEKCAFSDMHIFPYSRRPGTPADKMEGQLSSAVKAKRSHEAQRVADKMHREFMESSLGQTLPVLFETAEGDGFSGHSDTYLRVEAPGEKLRGSINQVRITGVDGELLTGEIID